MNRWTVVVAAALVVAAVDHCPTQNGAVGMDLGCLVPKNWQNTVKYSPAGNDGML